MNARRFGYGILGEDESDKLTIHALLKNLTGDPHLSCGGQGFGGCGDLLNRGSRALTALHTKGFRRFIICVDSDGPDPGGRRQEVAAKIVKPSRVVADCCIAIAIQEIEAWILADLDQAVCRWKGPTTKWRPNAIDNPEAIAAPKEHLVRLSKLGSTRPRYDPVGDNPRIAAHLDLDRVAKKCPSFEGLREFVQGPRSRTGRA